MASTRSRRGVLLDGPAPPRLRVAPASRANSWEDVADLAATLGIPLDEWQEQVLEAAMGEVTAKGGDISTSKEEIRRASNELSQRTERQAANLEETSAAKIWTVKSGSRDFRKAR